MITAAVSSRHLAMKPPLGGMPISERPARPKAAALSGATPFQRLFGLALTGCYLAKGAMVAEAGQPGRIALCRFAAENLLSETTALKDRVT